MQKDCFIVQVCHHVVAYSPETSGYVSFALILGSYHVSYTPSNLALYSAITVLLTCQTRKQVAMNAA